MEIAIAVAGLILAANAVVLAVLIARYRYERSNSCDSSLAPASSRR
jgi:hypothetical protein